MTEKTTLPAPVRKKKIKPDAKVPSLPASPEPAKAKRSTKPQPAPKKRQAPAPPPRAGRGRGRPTLYKVEYIPIAHNMCAIMGATNKELAAVLEVSDSTIDKWTAAHPEFKAALTSGKLIADSNVAAALYKTAVGYEHPDMNIRTVALGMNQGSEIAMTRIIKIVQPNPTSIQWWLKNRRPDQWKDKSEVSVEHSVPNEDEGRARFTDRMAAAVKRQAEVRASRRERGMTGD